MPDHHDRTIAPDSSQVTSETAHYPRVKKSLRANVHEPWEAWAIVVDRNEQGTLVEDLAQFEVATVAGSREHATANGEYLSVGSASMGDSLK